MTDIKKLLADASPRPFASCTARNYGIADTEADCQVVRLIPNYDAADRHCKHCSLVATDYGYACTKCYFTLSYRHDAATDARAKNLSGDYGFTITLTLGGLDFDHHDEDGRAEDIANSVACAVNRLERYEALREAVKAAEIHCKNICAIKGGYGYCDCGAEDVLDALDALENDE